MLGKSKTWKVVGTTILVWLIGTGLFLRHLVTSALADPNLASFERSGGFQLAGFAFTFLPVLILGLLVVIFAELVVGELIRPKVRG